MIILNSNIKKRIFTSLSLSILLLFIIKFNFFLFYILIIFGVLSIIEFINLSKKITIQTHYLILLNAFFISYIFCFCLLFVYFSNFLELKILLFSFLLCCIASDLGGFIFGKFFKGPKLTKISPNKTFSGALGSLFLSVVVFSGLIFLFVGVFDFKILLTGLITSLSCQIGDLLFSFLKRKANIKDTSNFLPGHGGLLDRLDGIFLGIPIGILFLTFLY